MQVPLEGKVAMAVLEQVVALQVLVMAQAAEVALVAGAVVVVVAVMGGLRVAVDAGLLIPLLVALLLSAFTTKEKSCTQ
jgi:hypothetical protein